MSLVNHGCECAACTVKKMREEQLREEALKQLQEQIDRGDFDCLVTKTKSKDGASL